MTIDKIIENLERTIKSKTEYRDELERVISTMSPGIDRAATIASRIFLDANIDELQKILADLKAVKG